MVRLVDEYAGAAQLFAALADPVRLEVFERIAQAVEPMCVCNLQPNPPIPDNRLSYHLKVLRDAGLVTSERRGRWVDYTIAPDAEARLAHALPLSPAVTR
ncbi:ArsR family transcriptional regulator [Arcanobacterium wilhelmae]|uniref:ArsR family transcriptional regulator n=1 Tax=Arcanobacterium wilhelmae TaxID=1803177 RepID=A0ABT9NE72_9ACTO|nr:metalloregulator ArsR/SmtB family transcription factor [Arcanobacterium wilhelmae]MDP9801676.1 ArsR family transcriptional regulator [Arcanobacterium wilhelmae]WFN90997.1 metalloregulator ArsR/SmtB family transcription factor [Arcanobacterium wilhelmae]